MSEPGVGRKYVTIRVDIDPELHDRLRAVCENKPHGYQSFILRKAVRLVIKEEATRPKSRLEQS